MPENIIKENPTQLKYWRKNPKAIDKFQFVYHFLPHPERKSRATLLSNKSLIIYCLILILITGLFRLIPKFMPGVLSYASSITVKDLLEYTNQRRGDAGLSSLRLNPKLSEAAYKKAKNMFEKNYWAHVAPDGTEPWSFILAEKYDYIYAGENLAKNFSVSRDVVDAWYNSPSHKENLLSPNYDEVGFAVVNGVLDGYETTLVIQMFGRPRDKNQIATVEDEQETLKASVRNTDTVSVAGSPEVKVSIPAKQPKEFEMLVPTIDVNKATKIITLSIGVFIVILLTLHYWYSKKKGIPIFSGHTVMHITIFIIVLVSIWFVLRPGIVL